MRTAHAFGASFTFSVGAAPAIRKTYNSDTSKSASHVPYYPWNAVGDMELPKGCKLVGIELTEEAIDLPTFHHPMSAAYVLGGESRDLSPDMQARCSYIVKIPTRFCVNVALAGALVMYDRTISMASWAPRPVAEGGPAREAVSTLNKSRKSYKT
jgi:tRNA G18 (ribose-2'-O)-methylase SpoU